MNMQPFYTNTDESLWGEKLSKSNILKGLSENKKYETNQTVKIEYINSYEEPAPTKPNLAVIVEKVDAQKSLSTNLDNYNINYVKHKLQDDFTRKDDTYPGNSLSSNNGMTSIIEKFESKMMQNITTTYTEVLNEISKSLTRIQVLAKDNAEYQEDCLRTNVSEISRYLKIFPKRTKPLHMEDENLGDKSGNNELTTEGEEEVVDKANEMFFDIADHPENNDFMGGQTIKKETVDEQYAAFMDPNDQQYTGFIDLKDQQFTDFMEVKDPQYKDFMDTKDPQNNGFMDAKDQQFSGFMDTEDQQYAELENSFMQEKEDSIQPLEPLPLPLPLNFDNTTIKQENGTKKEENWFCKVCENYFSSKFALNRHQKRNIKCSVKIIEQPELKAEDVKVSKRLPLLKLYPTKSHQKFNPEIPYKPCFFCSVAFQRITELIAHLQHEHLNENLDHLADMLPSLTKDDLKPEIIRKRLNDEHYVKNENQFAFNGGLSRCSFCPNEFASFSRLLSHTRYVHPDCDKTQGHWTLRIFFQIEEMYPSKKVPCELCGKEIKVDTLHSHMSNHKQIRKECPECKKMIQSKIWQTHLQSHTEQEWLCNECGKSFKTQRHYRRHIPMHDPNFTGFECTPCNKMFDRKTSLMKHNSYVHEGTKRFLCQYCSYAAGIAGNLTLHIRRVHTKEKPSHCGLCDYKTIGSQELARHVVAVHETDKHHKCDVCGWTSPRKHLMIMHNRLNCKKPPFSEADKQKAQAIARAEGGPSMHIYAY